MTTQADPTNLPAQAPTRPLTVAPALIPTATVADTLAAFADVLLPTLAKGVILRRPAVVALAERLDLDRRAVRRMQHLRDRYGAGPLLLRFPVRPQALILSPDDVHRVLQNSPDPFATETVEKRSALAHFEPKNVLISHGPERADRRRFHEEALDAPCPAHRLGDGFVRVVAEEADVLLDEVFRRGGRLDWPLFASAWFRIVRRVTFGDGARDDQEITDTLNRLRGDANWAFLKPRRTHLRDRLHAMIRGRLDAAEPGSLAAAVAGVRQTAVTEPTHQVPQWLFAFDPAGMTTIRALALLGSHPEMAQRARQEVRDAAGDMAALQSLPFLRSTVLESLRLWPTTPMVLRETTTETEWGSAGAVLPAHTHLLIYAPFFHRDGTRLPWANRFTPSLWERERTTEDWPLIPFSDGPAYCPGRNLVLLLSSAMLAALLHGTRGVRLTSSHRHRLDPSRSLPGTLNNFGLQFALMAAG